MNQNDNVLKAIEMLQHHQLKKLVERAKAGQELNRSDLQLLGRLSDKLDAACMTSDANQKPKRGRPAKSR